jgi:hypothetical protein
MTAIIRDVVSDKPESIQAIPVHPKMEKKAMRFFKVKN